MPREDLLSTLIKELHSQSEAAQVNLGDAAMFSPMYGLLFCIRSVIGDQDPGPLVINELFNKCLEISELIGKSNF